MVKLTINMNVVSQLHAPLNDFQGRHYHSSGVDTRSCFKQVKTEPMTCRIGLNYRNKTGVTG